MTSEDFEDGINQKLYPLGFHISIERVDNKHWKILFYSAKKSVIVSVDDTKSIDEQIKKIICDELGISFPKRGRPRGSTGRIGPTLPGEK